jgi:hypothetical protein
MLVTILVLCVISIVTNLYLTKKLYDEGICFRKWTAIHDEVTNNIIKYCSDNLWQTRIDSLNDLNNIRCQKIEMIIMNLRSEIDKLSKQVSDK